MPMLRTLWQFYMAKCQWIFLSRKAGLVYYTDSKLSVENAYALYTPGLDSPILIENNLQIGDVIIASDHLPVIVDFGYTIVGVDDFSELDISIYPNPVSDKLIIDSPGLKFKI